MDMGAMRAFAAPALAEARYRNGRAGKKRVRMINRTCLLLTSLWQPAR